MKNSISLLILVSASIVHISCLNKISEEQNFDNEVSFSKNHDLANVSGNKQAVKKDTIIYYNNIDSRNGMLKSRIPLPSTWKQQNNKEYSYTGPNGIKIHGERSSMFMFSNDQQTNNIYQQSGVPIQFPKSVDQVINEGFMEYANKINRKLVKKYPIPQLAVWDKQYDDKLYKSLPSQKTFTIMGLEWRDPDGTSFLTVLHHFVSYDNYGGYWGIIYTVLESSEAAFEKAKRQYINGLLNQQINPQWLQVINQNDMQIAQRSNAAHQTRMADLKALGDQDTANRNARMAAMDQNMDSWRANQAADDRRHNQVIDNIRGTTNVSDPNTGNTYKVEAGANQYWMNNHGEYIKSDNSLYDPNLDKTINNQTWIEYKEQN